MGPVSRRTRSLTSPRALKQLEFSLKMFHKMLSEFLNGKPGSKKAPTNALAKNNEAKRLFDDVEGIINDRKRSKSSQHPKLETVKDLVGRTHYPPDTYSN